MPYQAVHSPSALPHHQSWTQAHPRHRLAPSSSLPSSHGIFTTVAEFLPPLATAGQPLSPTMMMKLTSTAPTLPPHRGSRAPAARGNPAPHLPLLSCSVCRMRGFGAQTPIPRVLPLPSHLPTGSTSCPQPSWHSASPTSPSAPALPAEFLSGHSLPPLSLNVPGLAHCLPLPELPGPSLAFTSTHPRAAALQGQDAQLQSPLPVPTHPHVAKQPQQHPPGYELQGECFTFFTVRALINGN